MKINFSQVEGSVQPEAVDDASSSTTVYIHNNIHTVEKTEEQTGKTYTTYQYNEAKLTRAEYAQYLAEQADAKSEYVAMMSNVNTEDM